MSLYVTPVTTLYLNNPVVISPLGFLNRGNPEILAQYSILILSCEVYSSNTLLCKFCRNANEINLLKNF